MIDEMHFYSVDSDGKLEFLHTESLVTSVQWHLRYDDVGSVEINTDIYNDLISYILPQVHSDVIVVQGNKSAWIHAETDITGDKNNFMIAGKALNHILKWRVVTPFTATGTVENIIRNLITQKFMTVGDNYISEFALAPTIGGTSTTTYTLEYRAKTLFDVVQDLCKIDNLGFAVDVVNEQLVFRLYRGLNKTRDQTDRPMVILSEDLRTFSESEYVFMQDDYFSCGYYPLKDEETNEITWTEIVKTSATGFERREAVLSENEETLALKELGEKKKIEEVSGKTEVKYGIDYELGDLVTVEREIGNTLIIKNKRVVGVDIVMETNDESETPILEEV